MIMAHVMWSAALVSSEYSATLRTMKKVCVLIGSTIGGSLGWAAGSGIGFMTAFMISMIGTGIGMYAGFRVAERYAP